MFNKKMQYVIKSVPTDDKQALEDLLNEMSDLGWELYTMHEIETDTSFDFNCIFVRQKQENEAEDLDEIINVTSFKSKMEKMLATPTTAYATCREIQLKISNQKDRIKRIKDELENDRLSVEEKNKLNNQMSDELRQLDSLKQSLVNEISPDNMFLTIKEEKFTVNLSEEILSLIDLEYNDGLLSETVKIRQKLTDNLGYVIPHIYFHNDDELNQHEFSIKLHDIEVFRGIVFPEYLAYFKDDIKGYKPTVEDVVSIDNITGRKLIWINENKTKDFWVKGLSAVEYIGRAIEHVSITEVADIMDYNDVNKYIEIVLENNAFLVDNIIPEYITIADLKYLLTCLIREQVSIKNIIYLFEKINDYANEPTKEDLLDKVRLAFSKLIMKDLVNDGVIKVIEFTESTLEKVEGFFDTESDENIIRIDAFDVQEIANKINKISKSKKLDSPILVVPMDIRHMCFVILSEFVPNLRVLACEELVSDFDVKFVGTV
ncbi:FHIPEP family type III secretion protein [bacterium]|nr:FHIPEP family type III secretion protein [bacterium]